MQQASTDHAVAPGTVAAMEAPGAVAAIVEVVVVGAVSIIAVVPGAWVLERAWA